jgi:hypothetical protein
MRTPYRRVIGVALAVTTAGAVAGCDSFLDIKNPGTLEADMLDPERDGGMFSRSAFQNLIVAFGSLALNSAWFTNEARVGDTFPTRNEFGRRDINEVTNGTHSGENWAPLQRAIATGEDAIRTLEAAGGINLARAYFTSGFGIILMGELFCEGTVKQSLTVPGPRLTTAQMMDLGIQRLTRAREVAGGISGTDAANLATAALVGIARAHLFVGRTAQAAQVASQVPTGFVYNLWHVDDPGNRGRLGNNLWAFSESRISLVVGPEYRAMADAGDRRIAYVDMGRNAQDGVLRFFRQDKFKGWAAPIRFASGLEARYIRLEAERNLGDMVAFINERRAAGNQGPFASSNPDAVLREFLDQHTRDFWLEARRMPAWRRNLQHMPYIIPPGDTYYKTGLGLVADQTCWPVPDAEKRNNPNW